MLQVNCKVIYYTKLHISHRLPNGIHHIICATKREKADCHLSTRYPLQQERPSRACCVLEQKQQTYMIMHVCIYLSQVTLQYTLETLLNQSGTLFSTETLPWQSLLPLHWQNLCMEYAIISPYYYRHLPGTQHDSKAIHVPNHAQNPHTYLR